MHVCDICCWYVNDARGCEAPRAFKEKACQEASKRKVEMDAEKKRKAKALKTTDGRISNKSELIENYREVETQCPHCKNNFKAMSSKETNSAGMFIEYAICPSCKHQKMISWHVW
jgi:hypothetical protein